MRLNFTALADSTQKTGGQAGTLGTASIHSASSRPRCIGNSGDIWGQAFSSVIGESEVVADLSPMSPDCPHSWGRFKALPLLDVPVVPSVPHKKHNNEIAHNVSDKRAAAVACIEVSTPVTTDTPVFGNDDRRYCDQCLNLQGSVCRIARPGGLVSASKGYRPVLDLPHRCNGFKERTTL